MKEHQIEFQKLADEGDEDFIGLMNEIETRDDFAGVGEGKVESREYDGHVPQRE